MSTLDPTVLQLSRRDRERYLCALCAPEPARTALLALLAFNQELAAIPQGVSDPMLGKIKLQWWIDALPGVVQDRPPGHPVAQALAQSGRVDGQLAALRGLAEARNFDLERARPQSLTELEAYAEASGGALHALMAEVLAPEDAEGVAAAREIGAAWALIGLMRALPYQTDNTRDMLPLDAGVQDVLARAAELLVAARNRTPAKAALPALLVARLADGHLKRLAAQGWDPVAREEPPAGAGAVLRVWWGKWRGRY